jgi:hypothetical protein
MRGGAYKWNIIITVIITRNDPLWLVPFAVTGQGLFDERFGMWFWCPCSIDFAIHEIINPFGNHFLCFSPFLYRQTGIYSTLASALKEL